MTIQIDTRIYKPLEKLYTELGFYADFIDDKSYLKLALHETEQLWHQNFNQLPSVKFIIIGEAPLWGREKRYIYNPNINNTSFFFKKDLNVALGVYVSNKIEFISQCIQSGIVFIDSFPFAFNEKTKLNFKTLVKRKNYYNELFEETAEFFFLKKLITVSTKCSAKTKIAFRYSRVKNILSNTMTPYFTRANFQPPDQSTIVLSKQGGLINKNTLSNFLHL